MNNQSGFKKESCKNKLDGHQKPYHKSDKKHQLHVETGQPNAVEFQKFRQIPVENANNPKMQKYNVDPRLGIKGQDYQEEQKVTVKDSPVPTEQELIEILNPSALK